VNLEQLGYFGIFLMGAIPWLEAIGVVPVGIIFGFDPVLTVIAASVGNIITIAVFAYAGDRIRNWVIERRRKKGIEPKAGRYEKAQKAFDKYGIYGMAALGPVLIGTQFAAAASVAAGVKPLKVTLLISIAMVLWAVGIAWGMTALGITII
jgi:Ca2+/H+ antiporter, TMEM165/GDT1 family